MQKGMRRTVIGELLFYGILLFFLLTVVFFRIEGKNVPKFWGGYSCMLVLTESMGEAIPKGSLVITQKAASENLSVGDDIAFFANETTAVTHRIIEKKTSKTDGSILFRTKGVANKEPDSQLVSAVNIIGRVVFQSYILGRAATFMSRWGFPILLLFAVSVSLRAVLRYIRRTNTIKKRG